MWGPLCRVLVLRSFSIHTDTPCRLCPAGVHICAQDGAPTKPAAHCSGPAGAGAPAACAGADKGGTAAGHRVVPCSDTSTPRPCAMQHASHGCGCRVTPCRRRGSARLWSGRAWRRSRSSWPTALLRRRLGWLSCRSAAIHCLHFPWCGRISAFHAHVCRLHSCLSIHPLPRCPAARDAAGAPPAQRVHAAAPAAGAGAEAAQRAAGAGAAAAGELGRSAMRSRPKRCLHAGNVEALRLCFLEQMRD